MTAKVRQNLEFITAHDLVGVLVGVFSQTRKSPTRESWAKSLKNMVGTE